MHVRKILFVWGFVFVILRLEHNIEKVSDIKTFMIFLRAIFEMQHLIR